MAQDHEPVKAGGVIQDERPVRVRVDQGVRATLVGAGPTPPARPGWGRAAFVSRGRAGATGTSGAEAFRGGLDPRGASVMLQGSTMAFPTQGAPLGRGLGSHDITPGTIRPD